MVPLLKMQEYVQNTKEECYIKHCHEVALNVFSRYLSPSPVLDCMNCSPVLGCRSHVHLHHTPDILRHDHISSVEEEEA